MEVDADNQLNDQRRLNEKINKKYVKQVFKQKTNPIDIYRVNVKDMKHTVCCICMESFDESPSDSANKQKILEINSCKHTFHQKCLTQWFQQNMQKLNCPVCKKDLDFTSSGSSLE